MSAVSTATRSVADEDASVAFGIADFLVRTEMERLRLFRRHLSATVHSISPLLVELMLMEGVHLGDAVELIHPPQDWPWRPMADFGPEIVRRSRTIKGWPGPRAGNDMGRFRRAFAKPGVVIRDVGHKRGRLAIRPCNGVLGFTAGLGPCLLSAFGPSAELKLSELLPETLMLALPGRPLGGVIDHPLFVSREYTIKRVMPDLADGLPVIIFRAPLVPFELAMPGGGARELEDMP